MKLKTLKDLRIQRKIRTIEKWVNLDYVDYEELKQEAIKWVKEDIKAINDKPTFAFEINLKWMKRLNITEDDLK